MSTPLEAATDIPDPNEEPLVPYDEMPRAKPVNYYNFTEEQLVLKKEYVYQLAQRYPNVPEDLLELATSYYLHHGEDKVSGEILEGKFEDKSKKD